MRPDAGEGWEGADGSKREFAGLRTGLNKGHPTTAIAQAPRPSQRKGVQSTKTKFVRSVIREVAGFSAYERRVMELLRNSKVRRRVCNEGARC